jgi:hypothetical protein
MFKLLFRLITFAIFLFIFGSAAIFIALASLGWINVQSMFPGLPDPPSIQTEQIPGDPFGDFNIPDNLRPGDSVQLQGKVPREPLFSEVPVPQQISTDPVVVGANFSLAVIMMLVFGITSSVLSNMLRDEEPRIQHWLRAAGITGLVKGLTNTFSWTLSRGVRRGCLTLPLVLIIFATYGIIFAFLDEGMSIFSRQGILLAVTLAFSVGLVSFAGDIARRMAARIWRERSTFNIYPVNLMLAIGTVFVSRVVNLSPGIVFGTPGGANIQDAPTPEQQARRDVALSLLTILILVILGAVGWTATGLVVMALGITLEWRFAEIAATIFGGITNFGLSIFLIALQTCFFEMLPFAYSSGRPVFKWNKIVWALIFLPIGFLFAHALLNPQYGFLESFAESDVRFLWFIMVLLVGLTVMLWFYFNVVDDILQEWAGLKRPRRRAVQPPPYQQPYPQQPGGYYDQQGRYIQPPAQGYDEYGSSGYSDPDQNYPRKQR